MSSKVNHDSVHGSVKVEGIFLELLQRPEIQRLQSIHQLGLAYYVFPGANHTRLEHSLGTYHMAKNMAAALELTKEDTNTVCAAAMLHDLGHAPYSHTLEEVIENITGMDHMNTTCDIIMGKIPFVPERYTKIMGEIAPIAEVLENEGISAEEVCSLISTSSKESPNGQTYFDLEDGQGSFREKRYLKNIISGPLDVDQMDYLQRDAYYTGVAHGTIDVDRLMQTVAIAHGGLAIHKSGLVAVEGLMVARSLMYTSVYFHKTVRIAEMMLCKAIDAVPPSILNDAHLNTDSALSLALENTNEDSQRIMTLLNYRRLYKKALSETASSLDDEQRKRLIEVADYKKRKQKEIEIADRAGVSHSDVTLDIPSKSILLEELTIGKTEVPVLDNGRVRTLSKYSPLARAIQARSVHDWAFLVSSPQRYVEDVRKAAAKVLFD